ncbi:AMP-binding protein [Fulvivirga lutea]|uniref:AMP-binding protein n=1 Tax=Fulvivirga lutea TaxID=2810512 RepID=A0A974WFL2_9BACT|nr:AMP-binding protein [Fulvivirga lutea]QSE96844.1 AMP-binding protein [Fulvivirga lutea]
MDFIDFNGTRVAIHELDKYKPLNDNEAYIKEFIASWNKGIQQFKFQTSGSTGKPKTITIKKSQIEASAIATINFLGLKKHTNALLCIKPQFIGGTMMIVRSLINEMNLIVREPSSNPLKSIKEKIHFAAFVPLQIHELLKSAKPNLELIEKVIIGGAPLSESDIKSVSLLKNKVYSTYGMTETVSHIALKQISPILDNYYRVLSNISVRQDNRGCLIINGAVTDNKDVITNDVVSIISENEFEWLGRHDNVINSGGIKIQSEQLESKINTILNEAGYSRSFFIAGLPDEKLGEKVVLLIEGEEVENHINELLSNHLDKYECPKEIFFIKQFTLTESGKIDKLTMVRKLG